MFCCNKKNDLATSRGICVAKNDLATSHGFVQVKCAIVAEHNKQTVNTAQARREREREREREFIFCFVLLKYDCHNQLFLLLLLNTHPVCHILGQAYHCTVYHFGNNQHFCDIKCPSQQSRQLTRMQNKCHSNCSKVDPDSLVNSIYSLWVEDYDFRWLLNLYRNLFWFIDNDVRIKPYIFPTLNYL